MLLTQHNIIIAPFLEGVVILLDKPYGKTSFEMVAAIRRAISKKIASKIKVGHAGTLDPLATGLLILCTGKATKIIQNYQDQIKIYTGEIMLGSSRPSYDCETEIDASFPIDHIDQNLLEEVRRSFLGKLEMVPPIHSAVKIDGKRAYKLARKGLEPELKPKIIVIEQFEIDSSRFPLIQFKIQCSKGTYIRAVAHEFGKRLKAGAYLASLRREAIGQNELQNAWQLDELIKALQSI